MSIRWISFILADYIFNYFSADWTSLEYMISEFISTLNTTDSVTTIIENSIFGLFGTNDAFTDNLEIKREFKFITAINNFFI